MAPPIILERIEQYLRVEISVFKAKQATDRTGGVNAAKLVLGDADQLRVLLEKKDPLM